MSNSDPNAINVDAKGLKCPEPIMLLHQAMRRAKPTAVIHFIATDPSTSRDIPNFCNHLGHELVDQQQQSTGHGVEYVYIIRKKSSHLNSA